MTIKHKYVLLLICLCIIIQTISAKTVWGSSKQKLEPAGITIFFAAVHYIVDGDSFVVSKNSSKISIRLWGIDAPEYDQPHSRASKDALRQLISGKVLRIVPKDIDKYGRIVAIVTVDQITVNSALVANGSAWVHDYFCSEPVCLYWYKLQENAQRRKSGLWQGERAIEPWVWKMKK